MKIKRIQENIRRLFHFNLYGNCIMTENFNILMNKSLSEGTNNYTLNLFEKTYNQKKVRSISQNLMYDNHTN